MGSARDLLDQQFLAEVKSIAKGFGLSDQENHILALLLGQNVMTEEIAEILGTSPNTVSNQVKSILRKSKMRNRAELLSYIGFEAIKKLGNARIYSRTPRVMVVDDEPDICDLVKDALEDKGLIVETITNPKNVMEEIAEFHPDFVVSDVRMPGYDGFELMKDVRKLYHHVPEFIMFSGYSKISRPESMDLGAVDLLDKPIDSNRLFFLIVERFIENPYERSRWCRVNADVSVKLDSGIDVTASNIGFGGLFIPLKEVPPEHAKQLKVSTQIKFQMRLPEDKKAMNLTGEIVWVRPTKQSIHPPGFGVKFIDLPRDAKIQIEDFVRELKIRSFVPMGKLTKEHGPEIFKS